MLMDRDGVEVHKLAKKNEQAWPIKDLLYGFRGNFLAGRGGLNLILLARLGSQPGNSFFSDPADNVGEI